MKHLVLTNATLSGLQYGMLRDFEDEIVRITGADRVTAPIRSMPTFVAKRLEHGTRYSKFRRWIPKEKHELKADVLWVVLMGPESFTLDLYKGWDKSVGLKILYLFDTWTLTFRAFVVCSERQIGTLPRQHFMGLGPCSKNIRNANGTWCATA